MVTEYLSPITQKLFIEEGPVLEIQKWWVVIRGNPLKRCIGFDNNSYAMFVKSTSNMLSNFENVQPD